jgi:tetratricopeptide (TPR) repeat protein
MGATPSRGDLLSTATALAAQADWEALRAWLRDEPRTVATSTELSLLLAEAELRLGHPSEARVLVERVIPSLGGRGDDSALRRALNLAGAATFELGDLEAAEHWFSRALELASDEGDALLVARATNNLGAIANVRGRHEAALSLYQLAIPAYQRIGSTLGLAQSYHNMAITYRDARRLAEAEEHERRAVEFAREAGNPRMLAMARAGRAELSLMRGDAGLARAGASMAAMEYAAIPDPVGEADALRLLATARAALGEHEPALEVLDRALALAREHGSALVEAEALAARAHLRRTTGERAAAHDDARAALEIFTRLGATAERDAMEMLLREMERG